MHSLKQEVCHPWAVADTLSPLISSHSCEPKLWRTDCSREINLSASNWRWPFRERSRTDQHRLLTPPWRMVKVDEIESRNSFCHFVYSRRSVFIADGGEIGSSAAADTPPSPAQPAAAVPPGSQVASQKTSRITAMPKPCGIDPLLILQERENRYVGDP